MVMLRGGTLIDPHKATLFTGDLYMEEGRIVRIVQATEAQAEEACAEEVIDVRGLIVSAGLVDAHVHFRDPGQTQKEDILTGARAAAHGGYTSVIMMGNTLPHPDTPEVLSYMLNKGRETGIHVYAAANVTKGMQGKELTDMRALKEAGAVLFTDDGLPIKDAELFRRACAKAAELHMMISLHEEDPDYVYEAGVNEGKAASALGLRGAAREAEILLAERDIKIATEEGADIMLQHISCAETVELVRAARKKHRGIHAEATPHHFTLTEEAVLKHGTLAKMNPPLRLEEDRRAIIRGLADGTIEQIATDHAPHTAEEKNREFPKAPSGIIGLETALGLGIRELVQTGELSLPGLLRCMSYAPAALTGLPAGELREGAPADLLIFDPQKTTRAESFFSKASNSPFTGEELQGRICLVYAGGRPVYKQA